MDTLWLHRLFIQVVTFTGDYATVFDQQRRWLMDKGYTIMLLDSDYEADRVGKLKVKRVRLYYVSDNFITRLLGFKPHPELLNLQISVNGYALQ